ncbi:MAG TPA: DUF6210 family protein [Blastocatellia bacterium]|nr:DUF6210 family protein [Blastocatellia bacterium]
MDDRNRKPIIDLSDPSDIGLGLIILWPSGVIYTHQTGGYNCLGPEEEGVFVRLYKELHDQEAMLIDYFGGPKWRGWCGDEIDNETADFIDQVLSLSERTIFLKVDRSRLQDSHEAWIYVDVSEPATQSNGYRPAAINGFGNCKGVLIWSNTD